MNLEECKKKLHSWNKIYSNTEAQYKYIKPRFFIEEIVTDAIVGQDVMNYKFRVIYGKVIPFICVKNNGLLNYYNFDWKFIKHP
jgi:hypothetical protein